MDLSANLTWYRTHPPTNRWDLLANLTWYRTHPPTARWDLVANLTGYRTHPPTATVDGTTDLLANLTRLQYSHIYLGHHYLGFKVGYPFASGEASPESLKCGDREG